MSDSTRKRVDSDCRMNEFNQHLEGIKTGLRELEEATEKAVDQEARVESQLKAFGSLLDEFETNQAEILTLI